MITVRNQMELATNHLTAYRKSPLEGDDSS